jgi:hypothetical protein
MIAAPPISAVASAGQCAQVAVLALKILADVRGWVAQHSVLATAPLEAMAIAAASISPWRSAAELRSGARFSVWTYALDNHVERDIDDLAELDDLLDRCCAVACGQTADHGNPLLSALSDWHQEFRQGPLYLPLLDVWSEKFRLAMRGFRYDWTAGRARSQGHSLRVDDYLDHAEGILVSVTHMPLWIIDDRPDLVDHLDVLLPALSDTVTAIRLANDLATYSWEREQDNQNNILMYGVSPEWVRAEITRRTTAVAQRLAPLCARNYLPATELVRHAEWSTSFYALADFRGWGSDVPAVATARGSA